MKLPVETVAELQRLEESLWTAETRFDPAYMATVLTADFLEFGKSGRTYDLAAVLQTAQVAFSAQLPLPSFAAHELAPGVALVTYRSVATYESVEVANRASVWLHGADGRWRLRFHQGTPVSNP
jgi:ribonuclease HI